MFHFFNFSFFVLGETVSYNRSESESEGNESDVESPHNHFRFLQFLNLNNTSLSTWDEIDRLGRFPALKCLRIQGCPLFEVSLVGKDKSGDYTEFGFNTVF